ncbi:MAG TPA: hypothetical protein PJ982_07615 [Lacipirellulaceae bacterium]|nr:hypothetical protein [Lacipirellulaceae bacterium]
MRWRLQSEHGLTMLLMNRDRAHDTLPNAQVRAPSLPLMRLGMDRTWLLMRQFVEGLEADIVKHSLSRVDACVDLCETPVATLAQPFDARWLVARSRKHSRYAEGLLMNSYLEGEAVSGFTVGKSPLMLRVYDKLRESSRDPLKLAVLLAQRWGCEPASATRVEFQLHRAKLKDLGIDTVDDWLAKRVDALEYLSHDWFRLTDGPVDRKHPERSLIHPAWQLVRDAFHHWAGAPMGESLAPLPKLWIDTSRLHAMATGILKGSFARAGKSIQDNEHFIREAVFAVREAVGERDMAAEVTRRALELGASLPDVREGEIDEF